MKKKLLFIAVLLGIVSANDTRASNADQIDKKALITAIYHNAAQKHGIKKPTVIFVYPGHGNYQTHMSQEFAWAHNGMVCVNTEPFLHIRPHELLAEKIITQIQQNLPSQNHTQETYIREIFEYAARLHKIFYGMPTITFTEEKQDTQHDCYAWIEGTTIFINKQYICDPKICWTMVALHELTHFKENHLAKLNQCKQSEKAGLTLKQEHDADIQACTLAECETCITEYAQCKTSESIDHFGYMTRAQCLEYLSRNKGKQCRFHFKPQYSTASVSPQAPLVAASRNQSTNTTSSPLTHNANLTLSTTPALPQSPSVATFQHQSTNATSSTLTPNTNLELSTTPTSQDLHNHSSFLSSTVGVLLLFTKDFLDSYISAK